MIFSDNPKRVAFDLVEEPVLTRIRYRMRVRVSLRLNDELILTGGPDREQSRPELTICYEFAGGKSGWATRSHLVGRLKSRKKYNS